MSALLCSQRDWFICRPYCQTIVFLVWKQTKSNLLTQWLRRRGTQNRNGRVARAGKYRLELRVDSTAVSRCIASCVSRPPTPSNVSFGQIECRDIRHGIVEEWSLRCRSRVMSTRANRPTQREGVECPEAVLAPVCRSNLVNFHFKVILVAGPTGIEWRSFMLIKVAEAIVIAFACLLTLVATPNLVWGESSTYTEYV